MGSQVFSASSIFRSKSESYTSLIREVRSLNENPDLLDSKARLFLVLLFVCAVCVCGLCLLLHLPSLQAKKARKQQMLNGEGECARERMRNGLQARQ